MLSFPIITTPTKNIIKTDNNNPPKLKKNKQPANISLKISPKCLFPN